VKGPQHYTDNLKTTLLVLLWCNSDVSFPVLGYRYLNGAKISWAIGGGAAPSKYAHVADCRQCGRGLREALLLGDGPTPSVTVYVGQSLRGRGGGAGSPPSKSASAAVRAYSACTHRHLAGF